MTPRDLRRTLGLHQRPRRPRFGSRLLALGVAAAVVALALLVAGALGPATVPHASASGVTDRVTYDSIRVGSPQLDVRRLLGQPPRAVRHRLVDGEARECWRYARRSGRAGGYRFCFTDGRLAGKDRLSQTPS